MVLFETMPVIIYTSSGQRLGIEALELAIGLFLAISAWSMSVRLAPQGKEGEI